ELWSKIEDINLNLPHFIHTIFFLGHREVISRCFFYSPTIILNTTQKFNKFNKKIRVHLSKPQISTIFFVESVESV
ncbi:MAG: hypothetical protein MSH14_09055, partial [Bacteroidales bacterium]|nr:hypothetical protein [Bacteroidales bacterium]